MSTGTGWRRELHRIRDEHRAAMTRAAETLRRAQTPTADERRPTSAPAKRRDSGGEDDGETALGSVLRPAQLDRRSPVRPVDTEPGHPPRSWLV